MSKEDKPNGKVTGIEMQIALDQLVASLPYIMQKTVHDAKLLKKKYDSLLAAGFTEDQALEIVKARPIIE
jgi:alkylhydroperoxidase family enzyme